MNKLFKAAVAAILSVCAICGVVFAAACTDPTPPEPNKNYYYVSILYPDGKGVKGVKVTLTPEDGSEGDDPYLTSSTDDNGKATFDITQYSDATRFFIEISRDNIPDSYSFLNTYSVKIADGNSLNVKLTRPTYESVKVKLNGKDDRQQYQPKAEFEAGYYELRCITNAFTVTDGDDEFPATFDLNEGYNVVIVYYTPGTIYDIGTAEGLEFEFIFNPINTTGASENDAHVISNELAAAIPLKAGQTVYFRNPAESSVPDDRGGSPVIVDGENFKCITDGKEHDQSFPLAGGKIAAITTKDCKDGTAVVIFNSPSYKVDAEIGNEATLEIELLERTIKGNSETKTSLLWLTDVAKFTFTAERAGYYTITLVSDFESDKISISNIVSESSIVPKKITDADQSSNPYQATYFVSETNISDGRSKIFICDFESDSDYSSKKEGDKIIYKILIEYSETAPKA